MYYKDYRKIYIGTSDYASLVMVGCDDKTIISSMLHFDEDNSYMAYVVDSDAEIGSHYTQVAEFKSLLKIYDDNEVAASFKGDTIRVYRSGAFGCIIQILN